MRVNPPTLTLYHGLCDQWEVREEARMPSQALLGKVVTRSTCHLGSTCCGLDGDLPG